MKALLLFHFRVGVRVAIRASPLLFCAIVAAIIFQDQPKDFAAALANATFSTAWPFGSVIPVALIAFLLAAWSRPRLMEGMQGWLRHLPFSDISSRLAFLLALVTAQLPLVAAILNLPLRKSRVSPRRWRHTGTFINWWISWRALKVRILSGFALGSLALSAGWLFISNNDLHGSPAAAAARFAGVMACVFCLSSLSSQLATRRPAWPFARSFPWSAERRIKEDSLFLGAHALPLVLIVFREDPFAALVVFSVLPLMCVRAAESIHHRAGVVFSETI